MYSGDPLAKRIGRIGHIFIRRRRIGHIWVIGVHYGVKNKAKSKCRK